MNARLGALAAIRASFTVACRGLTPREQREEVARLMVDVAGLGDETPLTDDEMIDGALRQMAHAFEILKDREAHCPAAVERAYGIALSHLRSVRPVALGHLGELPEPGEPNVDPRGRAA